MEAWPQPGQFAVVARGLVTIVIRSGDDTTRSTAKPGGINGRMRFDKEVQSLQPALKMGSRPHARHRSTQSAEEPGVPGLRGTGTGAGAAGPARGHCGDGHWTAALSRPAHKAEAVRAGLERAGLGHRYLPPYSPDLNPIEPAWSKLKARLRTKGARSREALDVALGPALRTITAQDARGWFRLCGYGPAN